MFNKDITIINKKFNTQTKTTSYVKHTIKGFWSSNNGVSISNTMLIKANGVVVRVLLSEDGYLSPLEFKASQDTSKWTLNNDDYIVKGIVEETSISSINDILKKYECMKITNISIKDYGSADMQHFEISGE